MKYIVLFIAYLFCTPTFAGSIKRDSRTSQSKKLCNEPLSQSPVH